MQFELISFDLCPFVQRSVTTLHYKKISFKLTYVDLENPPAWFNEVSPLGKVPLLKVDDKTVLFESAIINEFIDEITPPLLTHKNPLQKAHERGWIEFGSELLGLQYQLFTSDSPEAITPILNEIFENLSRMEQVLPQSTPQKKEMYFRGSEFSLVDAAFAPLFMRLDLSSIIKNDKRWSKITKTRLWADHLLNLACVRESVIPLFSEKFVSYCKAKGSPLFS